MTPGGLIETAAFDTVDGLYDLAWSEENEAVLIAACGDGSIKVYDLAAPPQANPLRSLHEHKHEVRDGGAGSRCWVLPGRLHQMDGPDMRASTCCGGSALLGGQPA